MKLNIFNLPSGTVVFPVTVLFSAFLASIRCHCFCYFLCIVQHIFCCGSWTASCFTVSYQFISFPWQCPPPVFFPHVSCFMPSAFLPSSAFEAFFLNYLSSLCYHFFISLVNKAHLLLFETSLHVLHLVCFSWTRQYSYTVHESYICLLFKSWDREWSWQQLTVGVYE